MTISHELYSEMVNQAIQLQSVNDSMDAAKIAKQIIDDYSFKLKGISEREKDELCFQVAYSIVNAFR